jgi:RHS repeat-associated protein
MSYYLHNRHGDITEIVDDKGKILNKYTYDPFGDLRESLERTDNKYKYAGQQYDEITDHYYLRSRYYAPQIGRFIQEDAFRGDGLNLYAYVANNPLKYVDPSGYAKDGVTDNRHYPRVNDPEDEIIWKQVENTSDVYSSLSDEGMGEDNCFNDKYFEELKKQLSSWNRFNEPAPYFEEIFDIIKKDVINHGNNLNKLREKNKDNFDYLFESIDYLVARIGVDEDVHYFRNELNEFSGAPDTLDKMLELAQNGEWILLSPGKSQLHMYGENGEYNLKFVSKEGRFEAVYNVNNQLVPNDGGMGSVNMGTYNYSTPNGIWPAGHVVFDVLTWKDWGNIKSEPEKGKSKYSDKNEKMKDYHNYYKDIIDNNRVIEYYQFK